MKYVELIQNVHTGSVMSNILKHLTQTPIVFCFYDETLRHFRRIVPQKWLNGETRLLQAAWKLHVCFLPSQRRV